MTITICIASKFLSTLSLRRATWLRCWQLAARDISIHALLAESDKEYWFYPLLLHTFLSTLSLRRATPDGTTTATFFGISIHALLAESDRKLPIRLPTALHFYPRSPCGERRLLIVDCTACRLFLSTLSLRRATRRPIFFNRTGRNFYPRSPCGERHISVKREASKSIDFYPRSPCGERPEARNLLLRARNFYPRSPCGERPFEKFEGVIAIKISIHALLAESDANNHAKRQERHISIHALLAESDVNFHTKARKSQDFYPRSPCGERPDGLFF